MQTQEPISVLDIFKIGIGPSSSHTLGPWRAAEKLLASLEKNKELQKVSSIKILLYGSLAKTGRGHGTDIALMLGLSGKDPVTFDTGLLEKTIAEIKESRSIFLSGTFQIQFNPEEDIVFLTSESLPFHPNALTFLVQLGESDQVAETYYSTGGGFVVREGVAENNEEKIVLPYPVNTASDLITHHESTGLPLARIILENENAWRHQGRTRSAVRKIWDTMRQCIYRGCTTEGELPGGLGVRRRASGLCRQLLRGKGFGDYDGWVEAIRFHGNGFAYTLDWVSCFALAVNEENACFGRVVTAPTNGSAGVIPAVLQYFETFFGENNPGNIQRFLLVASEIGSLFKKGATISAAMGGCQAEIGVSSAMAAAGLTEVLGGSPRQVMMAAEIAMEHHLGLTCDPVGGLVQIPCIERNAMGAVKAITAAQLARRSDPANAKVSLDAVIKTMWETSRDMHHRYKETSEAGLAVNISVGLPEC